MLNDAMKDNPELRSVSERFFQQVSQRIKVFFPALGGNFALLCCIFTLISLPRPTCLFRRPPPPAVAAPRPTPAAALVLSGQTPHSLVLEAVQRGELAFSESCQSDINNTVPSPFALQVFCILGQQHPQALCVSHPREDCETGLRCDGDLPSSGPLPPLQLRQQQQQQKVEEAMSLLYMHVPPRSHGGRITAVRTCIL